MRSRDLTRKKTMCEFKKVIYTVKRFDTVAVDQMRICARIDDNFSAPHSPPSYVTSVDHALKLKSTIHFNLNIQTHKYTSKHLFF